MKLASTLNFNVLLCCYLAIPFVNALSSPLADPTAARQALASGGGPKKKFYGGAGIGRFSLDDGTQWQCAYDMVLVERIQGKPKTMSGLFVPQEDLPRLHLCRGESRCCNFLCVV
jgi:hypothetical protein